LGDEGVESWEVLSSEESDLNSRIDIITKLPFYLCDHAT